MGDSLFSVRERVRILSGSFQGVEGTVIQPLDVANAQGTVILRTENSELSPVAISSVIKGKSVAIRVPPELLERVEELHAN
jgi:hypothetical protein